jgi:hypothetical protein
MPFHPYQKPTLRAMADDDPVGEVIDGALNGVQPRVGARKALRSKLSDPLLISVRPISFC